MKESKEKFEERAQKAQLFVVHMAQLFELLIALVVIVALTITVLKIPSHLNELLFDDGFTLFLKNIFSIVIGIELLKMLCRHDLDSVVEVLLFAVAREMIIYHMPIYQTLIGVVAIAVLFMIRKFLFVSALDK